MARYFLVDLFDEMSVKLSTKMLMPAAHKPSPSRNDPPHVPPYFSQSTQQKLEAQASVPIVVLPYSVEDSRSCLFHSN